jgi:hypothetical protein
MITWIALAVLGVEVLAAVAALIYLARAGVLDPWTEDG